MIADLMDERILARVVENPTSQCGKAPSKKVKQGKLLTFPREARDCKSCGAGQGSLGNWQSFPAGFKFDPTDEELLQHLKAEIGLDDAVPHPLINTFISVLEGEDGICQTHPEHLPGVKKDGSSRHFFHRPARAYTTGNRKRRKIHSEDDEPGTETRWHKTGKTRPVFDAGRILGWKKIMVLYRNSGKKKSKPEKTNWILHQYHVGQNEEEADGQLVVCKVFYQKQPRHCTGGRQPEGLAQMNDLELNQAKGVSCFPCGSEVSRGSPITPKANPEHIPRPRRLPKGQVFAGVSGKISAAITQSSRESGLTVTDLYTRGLLSSEMTSVPGTQQNELSVPDGRLSEFCNEEINSTQLETNHQTIKEDYTAGWNYLPYEEVCTSGKSCDGEDENQVDITGKDEDECPRPQTFRFVDSQQHYQDEDMSLHCDEELGAFELFTSDFSYYYESGLVDEPCITDPNADYPPIDDILMDTPPALNTDFLLSSQEVREVIYAKPFPAIQTLDYNDSQSST